MLINLDGYGSIWFSIIYSPLLVFKFSCQWDVRRTTLWMTIGSLLLVCKDDSTPLASVNKVGAPHDPSPTFIIYPGFLRILGTETMHGVG